MGQKVSTTVLKKLSAAESSRKPTVDCPVSNFKCLRGNLSNEEIECPLVKVNDGQMSFAGLEQESRRLKEMKELKPHLVEQAGCKSREEAKTR